MHPLLPLNVGTTDYFGRAQNDVFLISADVQFGLNICKNCPPWKQKRVRDP